MGILRNNSAGLRSADLGRSRTADLKKIIRKKASFGLAYKRGTLLERLGTERRVKYRTYESQPLSKALQSALAALA